jgi:hypothetical protein
MRRSAIMAVLALALTTCLAACGGGEAPTLSNLSLPSTMTRGIQATGKVKVEDLDGLGGLVMNMRLTGPMAIPANPAPVAGASDSLTMAEVPIMLTLPTVAPAGAYTFFITATDGDDNVSNELSASVQVK